MTEITFEWQFVKNDQAANLVFRSSVDQKTMEYIETLLATAGFDGHVVLFSHRLISAEPPFIALLKWNHFEWSQTCLAIETAIKSQFPQAVFINTSPHTSL